METKVQIMLLCIRHINRLCGTDICLLSKNDNKKECPTGRQILKKYSHAQRLRNYHLEDNIVEEYD